MTRKVVTRSPHREVGAVNAGWILDHPVEHESWLEKRFIMVALSCPVVVDVVHQPRTLDLVCDEKKVRYTPDFLLHLADDQQIMVEVKPEPYVAKHRVKHEAAASLLAEEGVHFKVVTDKDVDKNNLSARAILLMRYGRMNFTSEEALSCKLELQNRCERTSTVQSLINAGASEELIWHMVARHELRIPPGLNLTPAEEVQINQHPGDCHDFFCRWLGLA